MRLSHNIQNMPPSWQSCILHNIVLFFYKNYHQKWEIVFGIVKLVSLCRNLFRIRLHFRIRLVHNDLIIWSRCQRAISLPVHQLKVLPVHLFSPSMDATWSWVISLLDLFLYLNNLICLNWHWDYMFLQAICICLL